MLRKGNLSWLAQQADFSLFQQLNPDPEFTNYLPNTKARQVFSGHYVPVKPTPLKNAYLIEFSRPMARTLGLAEEECKSDRFVKFFSGDISVVEGFRSWATPYALSIYGQEITSNCPFGTGNGYGDGRAISVAEVVVDGQRWELQLKGAGTTPFCRGADGRAVLRSSVREFIASEAMFNLGVSTTRALSLVASQTDTVQRPWFSGRTKELPGLDDPRLSYYPPQLRPLILAQMRNLSKEPDVMETSKCAITCRVSPSFLRVGQIELFGRRARYLKSDDVTFRKKELEMIVQHLLFREFPDIHDSKDSLQEKILRMLRESSVRIANLTANWLRVGYTQGNFNSDNCLVAGRTMDYGPFGFIEKFERLWNMWTGGGEHFGFLNQPVAGAKNFSSLVDAVFPLLDREGQIKAQEIAERHLEETMNQTNSMWARKLGFSQWSIEIHTLHQDLLTLMEETQVDYTLMWRQFAFVVEKFAGEESIENINEKALFEPLNDCFYDVVSPAALIAWLSWLKRWLKILKSHNTNPMEAAQEMRKVSPKFVPREWMLVNAYTAAINGDHSLVTELQNLFLYPYDEQTEALSNKFYKKAPPEVHMGGGTAGTSFMT